MDELKNKQSLMIVGKTFSLVICGHCDYMETKYFEHPKWQCPSCNVITSVVRTKPSCKYCGKEVPDVGYVCAGDCDPKKEKDIDNQLKD